MRFKPGALRDSKPPPGLRDRTVATRRREAAGCFLCTRLPRASHRDDNALFRSDDAFVLLRDDNARAHGCDAAPGRCEV